VQAHEPAFYTIAGGIIGALAAAIRPFFHV
jgi:hypothetical protein